MAHPHQLLFVELLSSHLGADFSSAKVLEIGSYDIRGSIRSQFPGAWYVGVDLIEGPGVDVVAHGEDLAYDDFSFDIAISCECFEHNQNYLDTFLNMHRMTKPGGIVCFTCASTGRWEHGTARASGHLSPGTEGIGLNYYRNLSRSDFVSRLDMSELFDEYYFFYNKFAKDLYFVGIKLGQQRVFSVKIEEFMSQYKEAARLLEKKLTSTLREKFKRGLFFPINCLALVSEPVFQNIVVIIQRLTKVRP